MKCPFRFQCRVGVNHLIPVAGRRACLCEGVWTASVEARVPMLMNLSLAVCSSLQVAHTRYTLHHWPGAPRWSQGMVTQCGGECCTWGTRFQGGDTVEMDLDVRVREVQSPSFAAEAQPLLRSPDAAFLRWGVGGLPILLYTPSPDPLTPSLQYAGASQLHPKLGPKLGPFCLAAPRSQPPPVPLRDLRFTGPLGSITSSYVGPLFLVLILGCEVTQGTSPSPVSLVTLVILPLLGLSSALTLSSSFGSPFGHPGHIAHLLPDSASAPHPTPPPPTSRPWLWSVLTAARTRILKWRPDCATPLPKRLQWLSHYHCRRSHLLART